MSSQLQVSGEAKIRAIQGPVVANSGVISALDGAANQYVRGDGTLASFPTSGGGGSSVSYYLNGSVNQGTFGGSTYYQMSKNAIVGTGTNFSTSANGLIAQFITDANDPDVVSIPSGNWNIEFFMSVSASSGALASFYVEIYKYNGSTFTLLATNVATPEQLTNTTTIDAYFTSVAMPLSAMAITDRLAVRIFANVASKTVTLYTEDNRLCQIVTTFSKGMLSLNNLTDQSQYLTTGTSGTNFAIVSSGDTHTFNLPVASATNTGKLSSTDWSTFNGKVPYTGATGSVDLGFNSLSAKTLTANGNAGSSGSLHLKQNDTINVAGINYGTIATNTLQQFVFYWEDASFAKRFNLDFSLLTPLGTAKTFTLPDLSGTLALLEGTQTFSGAKTFSAATKLDASLLLKDGATISTTSGYGALTFVKSSAQSSLYLTSDTGFTSALNFVNTSSYNYTFPASSGTIALTSNLSSYVPYTGATGAVNLGAFDLTVNGLTVGKGGGSITSNTAVGVSSLVSNTTGIHNSGFGFGSLVSNTTGDANTAVGSGSMGNNITGYNNVAVGYGTLNLSLGSYNVAVGSNSLGNNTTGYQNTAVGPQAGLSITTGANNTIIGAYAGTAAMSNNIILADGAGNIRYQWNGTNNVFTNPITGTSATFSGRIDIGTRTASPNRNLNIYGATNNNAIIKLDGSDGNGYGAQIDFVSKTGGGTSNTWTLGTGVSGGANAFELFNGTSTILTATIAGNVGIGTNNPLVSLQIGNNSASYYMNIAGSVTSTYIGSDANGTYIGNDNANPIRFVPNNTERMRITSGGALKATTDGTYLNSGAGYHEFTQSNTDTNLVIFRNVSASPYGNDIRFTNAVPNNNTNYYLRLADSSARCVIYSNGGIYNYQANDVNLSDERTKKDIIPLESYWDKFKALEIVKFKYIDQTHDDFNIGVIAQQVEKVAPEFVDIDGWDNVAKLDEEGNKIVSNEEPLKAIYTADLYHATIKVLQEAMLRIEEQQAQIEELKALIAAK